MNELDLFAAAIAITDSGERAALLDRECAGQSELRGRIEQLLEAHFRSHPLLDAVTAPTRSDAGPGVATKSYHPSEAANAIIAGRYTLVDVVGEGGMGSVWRAKQTEPVKRFVAVKLIRVERGQSKTILARFEAERQAIALMDHPHIAKLLDAGTTDDGAPFFVMELVKGVPLNDYCDQHRLTIPERLTLFTQICSAVQHAHQKGIIHRDLKPSNILVESHDGKPVPKVIDFGLAKATTGLQISEQSMHTAFGSVMGTPTYMAPEQASFNAIDIDTRADIYSLGVILYELLTGTTPITRETLKKAALDEMLRLIREQEAPTPSSRLSSSESRPSVAANRQLEPAKLGRFVRGELDWIVMKALSKERDRRYETANGFAKDIERFLNHEPVVAGPPSASYRFKKFVQRNKVQVIAAGLVLLALLLGIVGTTWGLLEARRQEGLARKETIAKEKQREIAEENERKANVEKENAERAAAAEKLARQDEEREKKYAQAIAQFVKDDFLGLTSVEGQERFGGEYGSEGLDRNTTLMTLLDRAAAKLKERQDLDPRIEAELCWIIGVNYRGAGEAAKGIPFLERAVELRKKVLGVDGAGTLHTMNSLAVCYIAAGKRDLALSLLEETFKRTRDKLGPDDLATLISMDNLAVGYQAAGKFDLALSLHKEVLKLLKAKFGPDNHTTLISMDNLAECLREAGELELAMPLYEETLSLFKSKLGPSHSDTLKCMSNLALCYQTAGKHDLAIPLSQETLRLRKAKLGPAHPDTLISMYNLASCYHAAGSLELAVPLYEETLKLNVAKLGPDHFNTLRVMNNLAGTYQAIRRLDLALPLFEETLKLRQAKLGPDHPATMQSMNNLAVGYHAAGKLVEALALFEELLALRKLNLGPDHPDTLTTMNSLAACYWSLRRLEDSIPLFEELLPLKEKRLGRQHNSTLSTVANLGVNYKDAGRVAEAIPLLEEAYQAARKYPTLSVFSRPLLEAYAQAGETAKAVRLMDELLANTRQTLPKDDSQLAGQLAQFGSILLEMKGFKEAEPFLRECLAIREKIQPNDWTTFNTQSMLGGALLGQTKLPEAEPLLLKGYEGMKAREKSIPPQGATRIPEALDRLIELYTALEKPDEVKKYQAERDKYPKAPEGK
ncbi:MAG TPA: serine/threonine-protein kinase [Gemmatales bacterium]|nr:serine/threonine-protein kinase [Gemmatales bacterium]